MPDYGSKQAAKDSELTYRMSLLPFGTYSDPNGGHDTLGFAVPGMIQEPINALVNLFGHGNFAKGPDYPGNADDMRTLLFSMYGGNALNPLTALPENAVGMFAGRMAKTADHAALARAEEMAGKGASRDDIWNQTGWFQGPDQKWRFEIDDNGLRTSLGEGSGFSAGPIEHPGLAAAYPDAAVYTRADRAFPGFASGAYHDGRGFMTPSLDVRGATNGARRRLAAHEGQHFIQDIEGFAPGANDMFPDYHRTAGEVEARAVENRLAFDPQQRAARPPWLDYDVPEGDQILFSGIGKPSLFGSALPPYHDRQPTNALLSY